MERPRLPLTSMNLDSDAAEESELDLADLVAQILARKWFIGIIAILGAVVGAFLGQLPPNEYRAGSVVQIEKRSSGVVLPEELIGSLLLGERNATSSLDTEVHIIRSRLILEPVVKELRVDDRVVPVRAPVIGDLVARRSIPFVGLFLPSHYQRAGEKASLEDFSLPEELIGVPLVLRVTGVEEFELRGDAITPTTGRTGAPVPLVDGVSLAIDRLEAPVGREYVIFREPLRDSVARLVEGLAVRERGTTGIVDFSFSWDDPEESVAIINAVVRSYQDQNLRRRSAEIDQSIAFIEDQLPEIQAELATATEALAAYRDAEEGSQLSLGTQELLERVVEVQAALEEIDYREEQLAQTLTPNHPDYRALLAERERLERRLAEFRESLRDVPEAEQELARLTERVEGARQLELQLTARVEQLRVLKASTVGNIRVLEPAEIARLVGPDRTRPILIGFALALFGSTALVLGMNFLRRGIEDAREIEGLGLSLYGSIPKVDALVGKKAGSAEYALAVSQPDNLSIESLRGLRTGLQFSLAAAQTKTIMITSCAPSDGKSFVSLNLAIVMAQAGRNILLIDCDMRRGGPGKHLGQSRKDPGLSDYLADRRPLEECLNRDERTGIEIIATGAYPPNPAELLASSRFAELVEAATSHYDTVILDAPPALAVTDPAIIGQHAGVTMLIVRHLTTTKAEVQSAQKTLATGGVSVSGVVLNQYDQKRSRYGSYNSRYSYHYGGYRYKYNS